MTSLTKDEMLGILFEEENKSSIIVEVNEETVDEAASQTKNFHTNRRLNSIYTASELNNFASYIRLEQIDIHLYNKKTKSLRKNVT